MPPSPPFSDAYIASLLVRDATAVRPSTSTAYSAMGLGLHALPSSRQPPAPAPKPNTRFLRNVLKETEGFNKALRAREREEAGGRFRGLAGLRPSGRERAREDGGKEEGDHGGREGGREGERGTKGGREDERGMRARDGRQPEGKGELRRHGKRRRGLEGNGEGDCEEGLRRRRYGRVERVTEGERGEREREAGREMDNRRRRKRKRAVESGESEEEGTAGGRRRPSRRRERRERGERLDTAPRGREMDRSVRARSVSAQRHGPTPISRAGHSSASLSKSPNGRTKHGQHNHTAGARTATQPTPTPHLSDSDSDPLESLIGPLPPPPPPAVLSKGRGAFTRTSSNIDAHFCTTYDAAVDVQPPSDNDDDDDDWEEAVEAFRDRQKWKRQGAERLRLAGFSAEQVAKWERGGGGGQGGDVEDVKWRGRGEGREWDRGKVVDEEGFVGVRAEWRGKGEGKGS